MFFIRNLALPFILIASGPLAVLLLISQCQAGGLFEPWAAQVRAGLPALLLLPVVGACWAIARLLQIWRWRRGVLDGGCRRCQGVVAAGRCRMCGDSQ